MNEACHTMREGEILNADKTAYPLFHAVLYGDRVSTAKFSKRLSCAIKHLPVRVNFAYEYDTLKAVEQGVTTDPIHWYLTERYFSKDWCRQRRLRRRLRKN